MVHHNTFWILSLMERCILSKSGKSEILLFLIWPGQQLVIWSISPGLQLNHKTAITFGYAYFENDQRLLVSTFIMEVRWLSYWLWTMFQRLCGQQLKYKNFKKYVEADIYWPYFKMSAKHYTCNKILNWWHKLSYVKKIKWLKATIQLRNDIRKYPKCKSKYIYQYTKNVGENWFSIKKCMHDALPFSHVSCFYFECSKKWEKTLNKFAIYSMCWRSNNQCISTLL